MQLVHTVTKRSNKKPIEVFTDLKKAQKLLKELGNKDYFIQLRVEF
jgi:hypothetical protein|tara:strand:- start:30 stop:167 length:138 start_codon:yes stop_codon:yes gene_type:complete